MTISKGQQGICIVCNKPFIATRYSQKACSYVCGYTVQNAKRKRGITNHGHCARCGKSLAEKKSHAIYCSKTCKSMDHTFKHRSKTRVLGVARRRYVFERDGGKCYMCGIELTLDTFELDHLLPVAKGGSNSESNLAVSCRRCNRSRGTRMGEQQLLKLSKLGLSFDY